MNATRHQTSQRPVLRFFVAFAVCMAAFYGITLSPPFQNGPFQMYLRANATGGAWILSMLGEQASADDRVINGRSYTLSIERGCDAIEPSALFAAAVIALPVLIRRRMIGLLIGIPVLLVANVVRVVSLYYVGAHWPGAFDTIHVTVWQPLFILIAMLGWIVWSLWATRPAEAPAVPT